MIHQTKPIMALQFWDPRNHIEEALVSVDAQEEERVTDELLRLSLVHNISILPRDLIGKLYIHTMRKFWRKYVPLTAKPPTWLPRKNRTDQLLWNARYQNVHFLHLPFNTLPQNKKFIKGCRCYDCLMATLSGKPLVYQRVPLSCHEQGLIIWDEDDNIQRVNYPGEKINTHFLTGEKWVETFKNKNIIIDFSDETKSMYS
tara:strand:- start:708 stop:1310 length:603 start_codon:yes stop_codon:yes gene_type:complete